MRIPELARRLRYLLSRHRYDQELASDLEFHREMAAREGRNPLGDTLRLREDARSAWGWMWIDHVTQDVRYAVRKARHSPTFTLSVVLVLALGIGPSAAAFGLFNALALKPLPVKDPSTLISFQRWSAQDFADNLPYAAFAFYRERTRTLSAMLALSPASLEGDGQGEPVAAHFVTANYFAELGAVAALGRMLDGALDDVSGAPPAVVLSHRFWQRRFGSDPLVAGTMMRLNRQPVIVVGVASPAFSGLSLEAPEVWLSIARKPDVVAGTRLTDFSDRGVSVRMWGRLRQGVAPHAAEQELKTLAVELRAQHPTDTGLDESFSSRPAAYATGAFPNGNGIYMALVAVASLMALIFSVACSNIGSLLLARGLARTREFAIRSAIGAARGRLFRQLVTEHIVLALFGSVAGLLVCYLVLKGLIVATAVPSWLEPMPDWRVILFALFLGIVSVVAFGAAPAWQVARRNYRSTSMRQILIGIQVAASCLLLIVAGLLVRALDHALSSPQGFDYDHVISIDPGFRSVSPIGARSYLDALRRNLDSVPGVASVSVATNPPLGNRWSVMKVDIDGGMVDVHVNNVDPAFFETMTIPIVRGRSLMRDDARGVVISDSLARLQWPSEDPVGKSLPFGNGQRTVVGVAGSARLVSPEDSDAVELYQLAPDVALPSVVVLVKTSVPPEQIVGTLGSIARSIDPTWFPRTELLKDAFQRKVRPSRYAALAVSVLGITALLLAAVGVVGLVLYAVSQRTKDIGIRIALGASPTHVLSSVLFQFVRPVVAGLIVGLGVAAAFSQILRRILFGVSGLDPIAYLSACALFAVIVTLAALVPARRALRVDPLRSLRQE